MALIPFDFALFSLGLVTEVEDIPLRAHLSFSMREWTSEFMKVIYTIPVLYMELLYV